jgi:hypothetical protein
MHVSATAGRSVKGRWVRTVSSLWNELVDEREIVAGFESVRKDQALAPDQVERMPVHRHKRNAHRRQSDPSGNALSLSLSVVACADCLAVPYVLKLMNAVGRIDVD